MEKRENIFLKKSFVVITGASRGLGRSIAFQFGAKFPSSSAFVLMARNMENLESVKSAMKPLAPNLNILVRQYDQGNVENTDYFKTIFKEILDKNCLQDDFEQYMIVHNCGTLGDVSKNALDVTDFSSVRRYFDINLTGMILLNTSFFQTFSDSSKSRILVNLTSAASISPEFPMHLYCAGQAARDMYMRVLALEDPSLRILTFSPGSIDTDMTREIEATCSSKSLLDLVKNLRDDGKVTTPDVPASILVQILEENTFKNATYVESEKIL